MNTEVPEPMREPDPLEKLMEDLAVLCDGPGIELRLSFDGAWIAMRSRDHIIWAESSVRGWQVVDGRARAVQLLSWFQQAAELYRERQNPKRDKKDVA